MTVMEIDTPHGPARAELHCAPEAPGRRCCSATARAAGSARPTWSPRAAARGAAGVHVALVEQPYRVAGRRAPAPAHQLDTAWLAVAERLADEWFTTCRWCSAAGRPVRGWPAARRPTGRRSAVLCLAFPVHPPGRPEKTRHARAGRRDGAHAGGPGGDGPVRHARARRRTARSWCCPATTR